MKGDFQENTREKLCVVKTREKFVTFAIMVYLFISVSFGYSNGNRSVIKPGRVDLVCLF